MIEKHERERKQQHGLQGERRGTDAAALDASGAALGSIGLMAFAIAVWWFARRYGPYSLAIAALAWLVVSVSIWRLQRMLPRFPARY